MSVCQDCQAIGRVYTDRRRRRRCYFLFLSLPSYILFLLTLSISNIFYFLFRLTYIFSKVSRTTRSQRRDFNPLFFRPAAVTHVDPLYEKLLDSRIFYRPASYRQQPGKRLIASTCFSFSFFFFFSFSSFLHKNKSIEKKKQKKITFPVMISACHRRCVNGRQKPLTHITATCHQ